MEAQVMASALNTAMIAQGNGLNNTQINMPQVSAK
jgi:hypothetical protein